jgi:hypothetical protein
VHGRGQFDGRALALRQLGSLHERQMRANTGRTTGAEIGLAM